MLLVVFSIYSYGYYSGYEGTNGTVGYVKGMYEWRSFDPFYACPEARNSPAYPGTCLQVFI